MPRSATTSAKPKRKPKLKSYHHGDLRAALIDSAGIELELHGLEAFSMRGVAKRAGVSHAAPAHHFEDTNGLLTALAAQGFKDFVAAQIKREKKAANDPHSQLIASGLAYIEFAINKPALYRLMFSSKRPDHSNDELLTPSKAAFQKLVRQTYELTGIDPNEDGVAMLDVLAIWSMVHGLADLLNADRLKPLLGLSKAKREAALVHIIERALPDTTSR